jgi:UDP-N-acetylglucosamine:LPS N-acetylglucosamine transferase
LFDAGLAGTPIIMVPGPIYETSLEGRWVAERDAGIVIPAEDLTRRSMHRRMTEILDSPDAAAARSDRLRDLVGSGGLDLAVQAVLRVIHRSAR